jgi:CDP-6-deoxy-D-xylo-4-hexulose-3-dehydrase
MNDVLQSNSIMVIGLKYFGLPGYNVRSLEMCGAIGIEQLKKLPNFIDVRIANAKHFIKLFSNHPYIDIQKEVGESSWFGFALIFKEICNITRREMVSVLAEREIECRPIVTRNFLKNVEVLEYFDYEVSGTMENAEYVDENGFFVGNHQIDISDNIDFLYQVINDTMNCSA